MDVRSKQTIREHLQKEDVQERILQYIQKGRDEATVTISRAAELFSITENKLRDWEEYGFLNPLRPGGPKGRRLYTPAELDKLAIIRELIDAGYAASDIPADIDKQWHMIRAPRESGGGVEGTRRQEHAEPSINQRILEGRGQLFWRYFVSQALRLALMLICEDIPHTPAGLVLPLGCEVDVGSVQSIEDIARVGEALVGWLSQSRSSHTLLTAKPTFQYSSDYRIEFLRVTKAGVAQADTVEDNTIIIVPREAKPLTLNSALVSTIRRVLQPLYQDVQRSRECFGMGMRDVLGPATDLESVVNYEDVILNGLTDMVVRLGGVDGEEKGHWSYSTLFVPNFPGSALSLQQRSLVVRAQSENAPGVIGVTTHVPQEPFISSCIKAFQSGHSILLPDIPVRGTNASEDGSEWPIRSSLAVPIEGSDGIAIAVLYVASHVKAAFTEDDQRVLRVIGRMIREVLETYQIRLQAASKLRAAINAPAIVDTQFQEFLSENELIMHIEELLASVQARTTFQPHEVVSFIAIDIDNQSMIANTYGDRTARDITRAVGMRIHSQLRAFKDEAEYKLYHICADRFYILLDGMPLEQVRSKAELLKQTLEGSYQIDARRTPPAQSIVAENTVTLSNISVRLGVSSYLYQKLKEVMSRYAEESAMAEMRMQITGFLEEELALAKQKGGNMVMSWDPTLQGFVRLSG